MSRATSGLFVTLMLVACSAPPDGGGGDGGGKDAGPAVRDGGGEESDGGPGVRRLDSIEPASGAKAGGTGVEVLGQGFIAGLEVHFGDAPCTGLVVLSSLRASCRTPAGTVGAVDVTARWADGYSETLAGAFTYLDRAPVPVAYTRIRTPAGAMSGVVPTNVFQVIAEVYSPGVTDGPGAGTEIAAEAGLGPDDGDPVADAATFDWKPMSYSGDADGVIQGDQANDLHLASITAPSLVGFYRLGVRFTGDGGNTWSYADLTGSDDGFAAADLPVMDVNSRTKVDYCHLQWPASTVAAPGADTEAIYGWVYHRALTEGAGAGAGILGEAGWGPDGTDPAASAAWAWTAATYNTDTTNPQGDLANDEYEAILTAPATGEYDIAFRFSLDGGTSWRLCDLVSAGGSSDGYQVAGAGALSVVEPVIDYCHLQWPPTLAATPGASAGVVYGWVYVEGVTHGAGVGPGIVGELGVGADGTDPATDASWTWTAGAYNTDVGPIDAGRPANDEYQADLVAPASAGSYDYAWRFRRDRSTVWAYCDQPGNPTGGSDDGYDPAMSGELTVAP